MSVLTPIEIVVGGKTVKLHGKNHHAYTYGHDPVLGWLLGAIGIMSRSITVRSDVPLTYTVKEDGNVRKFSTEGIVKCG
jgi:hypothetical protein